MEIDPGVEAGAPRREQLALGGERLALALQHREVGHQAGQVALLGELPRPARLLGRLLERRQPPAQVALGGQRLLDVGEGAERVDT